MSQLTEASDRERELLQQTATLQEQLTVLKTDLEHSHTSSSLKESNLLEENEALREKLEDARRDLKLNSEALTQTMFNCTNQVTALKSELSVTKTCMENERQARETLEKEVDSTRSRLAGAVKEAELCLTVQSDTERALLREKEEHQRLKDRLTGQHWWEFNDGSSYFQASTGTQASLFFVCFILKLYFFLAHSHSHFYPYPLFLGSESKEVVAKTSEMEHPFKNK